jgi:hypothetical protein
VQIRVLVLRNLWFCWLFLCKEDYNFFLLCWTNDITVIIVNLTVGWFFFSSVSSCLYTRALILLTSASNVSFLDISDLSIFFCLHLSAMVCRSLKTLFSSSFSALKEFINFCRLKSAFIKMHLPESVCLFFHPFFFVPSLFVFLYISFALFSFVLHSVLKFYLPVGSRRSFSSN